eukprot:362070-Chlamydomonas_euryale.AAC.2
MSIGMYVTCPNAEPRSKQGRVVQAQPNRTGTHVKAQLNGVRIQSTLTYMHERSIPASKGVQENPEGEGSNVERRRGVNVYCELQKT